MGVAVMGDIGGLVVLPSRFGAELPLPLRLLLVAYGDARKDRTPHTCSSIKVMRKRRCN